MGEDLGMGKASQMWKTCCVGCYVMGKGPMIYWDMGCECADVHEQLLGSYQAVSIFLDNQAYYVKAENAESRPKQHQLKVS